MGSVCSQPSLCSSAVQVWGPYDSLTEAVGNCGGGLLESAVIDCSFSTSNNEIIFIPNAISGKFYVLLVTNYAQEIQEDVTLTQILGPGTTDCSFVVDSLATAFPSAGPSVVPSVSPTDSSTEESGVDSVNKECTGMQPICSGNYSFTAEAGHSLLPSESANFYDCLSSTPDPTWYYLLIDNPGDITMNLFAPEDVDFNVSSTNSIRRV